VVDAEAIGLVHVCSWQAAYRGKIPQDYLNRLDPAGHAKAWRQVMVEAGPSPGILIPVSEDG
jgi:hypothetical protein